MVNIIVLFVVMHMLALVMAYTPCKVFILFMFFIQNFKLEAHLLNCLGILLIIF